MFVIELEIWVYILQGMPFVRAKDGGSAMLGGGAGSLKVWFHSLHPQCPGVGMSPGWEIHHAWWIPAAPWQGDAVLGMWIENAPAKQPC